MIEIKKEETLIESDKEQLSYNIRLDNKIVGVIKTVYNLFFYENIRWVLSCDRYFTCLSDKLNVYYGRKIKSLEFKTLYNEDSIELEDKDIIGFSCDGIEYLIRIKIKRKKGLSFSLERS